MTAGGPRVDLFLADDEPGDTAERIARRLGAALPEEFLGFPTDVRPPDDEQIAAGPSPRGVRIVTPRTFISAYLGFDIAHEIAPADWLTFPGQKLRTIAEGPVFHDAIGLAEVRARLAWYPDDVWLYLLAAGWTRIGQEEHLMGRAGIAGDEIGSSVIGARLARDLIRLCFLMERRFAPYPKWLGTAFGQLDCAGAIAPHLREALAATDWRERERHLAGAYELVAALHDDLRITAPVPTTARRFFSRPFSVIALNGFADAIADRIRDPRVRALLGRPLIGSIDQLSDGTDLVDSPRFRASIRTLYE